MKNAITIFTIALVLSSCRSLKPTVAETTDTLSLSVSQARKLERQLITEFYLPSLPNGYIPSFVPPSSSSERGGDEASPQPVVIHTHPVVIRQIVTEKEIDTIAIQQRELSTHTIEKPSLLPQRTPFHLKAVGFLVGFFIGVFLWLIARIIR